VDKNRTADMPKYRQFDVKVITKLANGSSKNGVSDAQSGFRAFSKRAMENLGSISENGMSASNELLRVVHEWFEVCGIPISCKYANSVGVKNIYSESCQSQYRSSYVRC
jgi:hypothetical protein